LEVRQGEIVALLGPSGCGKTTLLNIIAGFERPDRGRVFLGGRDITFDPSYLRRTSMVFQQYALFPHMTVFGNIIYGLSVRRENHEVARQRAEEVAALLRIKHLLDRYPAQLSGGQRQRVALARALAIRPAVLLLDEAFSALDRSLREEMQIELSILLRNLGITTILVTHDQREAFALANRVAVMESGCIRQFAAPEVIYRNPSSSAVFEFFGSLNRLSGRVTETNSRGVCVSINGVLTVTCEGEVHAVGAPVTVGIRAEDIIVHKTPTRMHGTNPFTVRLTRFLGRNVRIVAELGDLTVTCETSAAPNIEPPRPEDKVYIDIHDGAARIINAPRLETPG
jgi:ABC-type Fe3+/spermidine/putrescine transport system ATPase subunit